MVVFVGILGNIDKIAAVFVALFIFRSAFEPLVDSLKVLLDASVESDVLIKVREILKSDPRVRKIKRLQGRNSGRYKFIEAVIEISVRDLETAHRITEELEMRIKREIPNVDEVLIHYEPVESGEYIVAVPIGDKGKVSEQMGTAEEFMLAKVKNGGIVERRFIKNPFLHLQKGRGKAIGEFLAREGVTHIVLKHIPAGGSKYILEGLGIEILIIDEDDPGEALEEILKIIGRAF